jgi:hypothetical protein
LQPSGSAQEAACTGFIVIREFRKQARIINMDMNIIHKLVEPAATNQCLIHSSYKKLDQPVYNPLALKTVYKAKTILALEV